MKNTLTAAAVAAAVSLSALALTTGSAAAYIVCNDEGDCWRSPVRYTYPGIHVVFHPDSWYAHRDWVNDHTYRWRGDGAGRGYWRGGVWITF